MDSLDKLTVLERIASAGIIAVVRAENPEQALRTAEAARAGGVAIIEITLTVPGALKVIEALVEEYPGAEVIVGAGTVLDPETARAALLAGAEFIVGPSFNPAVVKLCNRYQKVCMPGCMTVTEIVTALEAGADVIKLFPGNLLGPAFVKAIRGPLPQVRLIPTGGVSLENVGEWIQNGCMAVGVGGELTKGAQNGDFAAVTEIARLFVHKVREAQVRIGK